MEKIQEAAKLILERKLRSFENDERDALLSMLDSYVNGFCAYYVAYLRDEDKVQLRFDLEKEFPADLAEEIFENPLEVYEEYAKMLADEAKKEHTFFMTHQILKELDELCYFEKPIADELEDLFNLEEDFENKGKIKFILQLKSDLCSDIQNFDKLSESMKLLDSMM